MLLIVQKQKEWIYNFYFTKNFEFEIEKFEDGHQMSHCRRLHTKTCLLYFALNCESIFHVKQREVMGFFVNNFCKETLHNCTVYLPCHLSIFGYGGVKKKICLVSTKVGLRTHLKVLRRQCWSRDMKTKLILVAVDDSLKLQSQP